MIDRLSCFYAHENSNVHRAAHTLAARATDAYEAARATVADFIGAPSSETIVFTRGATEAINLVAQAWGRQNVRAGRRDRDLAPRASRQHRALAAARRADRGEAEGHPGRRRGPAAPRTPTPICSATAPAWSRSSHVSNVLGTIVPVSEVIAAGAPGRRPGAHRRRPGRRAPADRRTRPGRRFLRVLRAQGVRAHRHRGALRQAGAAARRCRPGRAAGT